MLEITDISKSYHGVRVLTAFSLTAEAGEIRALLGHNGSGKSTLIKILAGYNVPDPGDGHIRMDGQDLRFGSAASSQDLGFSIVHQNLSLLPALTVLENLHLGRSAYKRTRIGTIDWAYESVRARDALSDVGMEHINVRTPVRKLLPVERAGLAVARALHDPRGGLKCLVLDEPTAFMPAREVARLRQIILGVKSHGVSVIYVTHRLEEVAVVADTVTVLRDGLVVGEGATSEFDLATLSSLVGSISDKDSATAAQAVSRRVARSHTKRSTVPTDAGNKVRESRKGGLKLTDVSSDALHNLSLAVLPGEVLAIISLVGGGVADVARLLRGGVHYTGEISVDGRPVKLRTSVGARKRGIVVVGGGVPSNLLESLSVTDNLTLGLERRFWKRGHLSRRLEADFTSDIIEDYSIRGAGSSRARTLSGGNRQKVAMARAIELRPSVLVALEPTTGVDVAGRADILGALRASAEAGLAVLVCTSDVNDVIGTAGRVIVVAGGRPVEELKGTDISQTELMRRVSVESTN